MKAFHSFYLLFFLLSQVAMASDHLMITGFTPFAGRKLNNSWEVVKEIARLQKQSNDSLKLSTCLLPTSYDLAALALRDCLDTQEIPVTRIISFGEEACSVNFETIAHNEDNSKLADNDGVVRSSHKIISAGDPVLALTLPIQKYYCSLRQSSPPFQVKISDSAGRFVCNNTAFNSVHELDVDFMFIHVPHLGCKSANTKAGVLANYLYPAIKTPFRSNSFSMPTTAKEARRIQRSERHANKCERDFFKTLKWKLRF